MVSLEMLGFTSPTQDYPLPAMRRIYRNVGDFIAVVGNAVATLTLPQLAGPIGRHVKTRALPVPNGGQALPDVRLSDHSPFWDGGDDAMMDTDTSFLRNPHHHRMSDTIDTLDLPSLAAINEGLDAGLSRL